MVPGQVSVKWRAEGPPGAIARAVKSNVSQVRAQDILGFRPRVREAHKKGSFSVYDRCQAVYERGSRAAPERR
jgi:hypothetical protein